MLFAVPMRQNTTILLAALATAGCVNDNTLTAGVPVDPCAGTSEAIHAAPETLAARSVGNVYRPSHVASAATAPPNADALLEAMGVDLDLVGARALSGDPRQAAAFPDLGALEPTEGASFAWLSTGVAGAGTARSVDSNASGTQEGTDFSSTCGGSEHDCVELSFTFQVPEDMNSVQFDFRFLSTEFPEYVNAGYNDEFTVSMSSPSHSYPNIVFDSDGSLVNIDSAFFDEPCTSLAGTGFDIMNGGACDAGGTGLLHTTAPVEPGETVTMVFKLLDRGDGVFDSAVAIDNLQVRSSEVSEPETNPCD